METSRKPKRSQDSTENVRLSRAIARILRHSALEDQLPMRPDGYLSVQTLIAHPPITKFPLASLETIQSIVQLDKKQRFNLIQDPDLQWFIRANQGHSMPDITPDLHRFNDPTEITHDVIHGTSKSAYRFIQTQGLSRMNRNHIHFAAGLSHDAKVISGIRQSAEVLIYLDVRKAMQDGMVLFRSHNNVILTQGFDGLIPPDYFCRVTDTTRQSFSPK